MNLLGSALTQLRTGWRTIAFILVSGLFALCLGLDDAFRRHEALIPKLGVPQTLVQMSYAAFMVFHLVNQRSVVLRTEYTLLVLSLGFPVLRLLSAGIRLLPFTSLRLLRNSWTLPSSWCPAPGR